MKLVIKDAHKTELFTHLFRNLPQICNSLNIQFEDEYMYIQSMDSHHVCLFELRLTAEWFDTYEMDSDDQRTISINTEIMQLILKCKSSSQEITFEYEGDPDKLMIRFDNGSPETYDKDFEMPLMTIEQDMLSVPKDSEWETEFEIKSGSFNTLMSEMEQFSDTLDLRCTEESFKLSANGANGVYNISFNIDDLECYSIDEDTTIETSYSVKYCSIISSFAKLSPILNIEASSSLPIKMTYDLGGNQEDDIQNYIKFYLAPKMKDDEF